MKSKYTSSNKVETFELGLPSLLRVMIFHLLSWKRSSCTTWPSSKRMESNFLRMTYQPSTRFIAVSVPFQYHIFTLYQDAALRLRTSLRTKVPTRAPQQRKSLRYKIMKMATTEVDPETSQVEGVGFRDLKRILAKHKLPTDEEELQQMELTGMLGRTQAAFLAKV